MKLLAANLKIGEETIEDTIGKRFETIGDIFSGGKEEISPGIFNTGLLTYIIALAGLLVFVFFIWGGFEILTSADNPEIVKRGRDRMLQAVIGFLILFVTFWLLKIIEIIFGIQILSG